MKKNECRIFGPPGTGKTTRLSELISEKCQEFGSESLIVASFTKTAAAELAQRDLPMDENRIGTLHALCYRMVDNPKLTTSKSVVDEWNAYAPRYTQSGGSRDLDNPWEEFVGEEVGDTLKQEYDVLRNLQVPPALYPPHLHRFIRLWEDFKANTGKLDFIDLIQTCLTERLAPEASIGFFDEVQDFSPLELALVRQWGEKMDTIYLAGDDDQAIFSWKGATPDAFLTPDLPPEQKIFLEQSYRLPRAVHRHVMGLVRHITPREVKPFRPRDAEGCVSFLQGDYRYPEFFWGRDVLEALKDGSVMVLATCGYMLDPLIKLLREEGQLYSNRWRRKQRKWNPLDNSTGASALDRVGAFLRPQPQYWGTDAREWTHHDLWMALEGVQAQVCARGAKAELKDRAQADPGLPVSADDLHRWFPDPATQAGLFGGDLRWLKRQLLGTATRTMSYAIDVVQRHGAVPPANAQHQLTVGTIHSTKGAQADTVFLLPDVSRAGWEVFQQHGQEAMTTRRQFYVGMTRARERLVLLDGGPLALRECVGR